MSGVIAGSLASLAEAGAGSSSPPPPAACAAASHAGTSHDAITCRDGGLVLLETRSCRKLPGSSSTRSPLATRCKSAVPRTTRTSPLPTFSTVRWPSFRSIVAAVRETCMDSGLSKMPWPEPRPTATLTLEGRKVIGSSPSISGVSVRCGSIAVLGLWLPNGNQRTQPPSDSKQMPSACGSFPRRTGWICMCYSCTGTPRRTRLNVYTHARWSRVMCVNTSIQKRVMLFGRSATNGPDGQPAAGQTLSAFKIWEPMPSAEFLLRIASRDEWKVAESVSLALLVGEGPG